jgi:glycosyltransferase involved in cell wall biosynthesis
MKILMNAYAVCPGKGSEPGMGWNWTTALAAHFPIEVVTEAEFKDQILDALPSHPNSQNLSFHFIDVGGETVRNMCWNQGDWRFYSHYRKWQRKAAEYARQRVAAGEIDLLHQLNMIGYREPGFLWTIPGPPVVWGPVGGFGNVPNAFVSRFPKNERIKQRLKSLINSLQYRSPRIQSMIRRSDLILAANGNSLSTLAKFAPGKTFLVNDAASNPSASPRLSATDSAAPLRLCWVGKWMPRKALWIALESMRQTTDLDVELHVVGMSAQDALQEGVEIDPRVIFHGMVTHAESMDCMRSCDALIFTSLHEGTPHVVLEALGCGTPVVCHDAWGQGDVVDSTCGIKVPLRDPATSLAGFEQAIRWMSRNRQALSNMRAAARAHTEQLTWAKSAARVADMIHPLLKGAGTEK